MRAPGSADVAVLFPVRPEPATWAVCWPALEDLSSGADSVDFAPVDPATTGVTGEATSFVFDGFVFDGFAFDGFVFDGFVSAGARLPTAA